MKLRKQLASLAVVGMMSVVAASSAFAAGVGYVNFDTLVQAHKDFPKVSAQMQSAIKNANQEFAKKAPTLKIRPSARPESEQTGKQPHRSH